MVSWARRCTLCPPTVVPVSPAMIRLIRKEFTALASDLRKRHGQKSRGINDLVSHIATEFDIFSNKE
jgi:hypothetical protein